MSAALESVPSPPMPLDDGRPCTLEAVIQQLSFHMETHEQWATWFEAHPEDPRGTSQFGDAAFHRKVEFHYSRMIAFLKTLTPPLPHEEPHCPYLEECLRGRRNCDCAAEAYIKGPNVS